MHPILLSRELRCVHCFCSFHFVFSTQYAQLDLVRGCLCALPIRSQTTSLRIYLHVFGKLASFLRKRANANVKKHFCFTKTKGRGEKRGPVVPSELAALACSVMKHQNVLSLPSHNFCCHVYIQRTLFLHTDYFASATCLSP